MRADPGQTNYSPAPGPVKDVEVVWTRSLGPRAIQTMLLADGTLYAGPRGAGYAGPVYALDSETGETRARVRNTSLYALAGTTSYADGMVLGSARTPGKRPRLLGINPSGGMAARRWQSTTPGVAPGRLRPVADLVAVADGTMYYCSRTRPIEIRALDVDDGREEWHRRFLKYKDDISIVADGDRLLVSLAGWDPGPAVHMLDPSDGHTRASLKTQRNFVPMLRDGTVYLVSIRNRAPWAGPSLTVAAHDAETLAKQWQVGLESGEYDLLNYAVGPDVFVIVVVYTANDAFETVAIGFDPESGDRRWRRSVPIAAGNDRDFWGDAVIGGETIYISGAAGSLVALRASDGATRWRIDLTEFRIGGLVVGDRRLYAFDSDTVYGMEEA